MAVKRPEGGWKALNEMEKYGLLALLAFLVLAIGYLLETLVAPAAPRLSIEPAGNATDSAQDARTLSAPASGATRTELLVSAVPLVSIQPRKITLSEQGPAPGIALMAAAPVAAGEKTLAPTTQGGAEESHTRPASTARKQTSGARRSEFNFFEAPVELPGHPRRPEFRSSSFRSVRIAAGDTLEKLARRELGDARLWRTILDSNPGVTPGRLRAGDELHIPVRAIPAQAGQDRQARNNLETVVVANKTHEVRRGDSLESIALRYYGNRSRWVEILEANRDRIKSPRELRPGMALRIP